MKELEHLYEVNKMAIESLDPVTMQKWEEVQDLLRRIRINLCDNCKQEYPACDGRPLLGIGKGDDNVHQCNKYTPRSKVGMYGEMPKITIGEFSISMMTDDKNECKVWIEKGDEGMEIDSKDLYPMIQKFYLENF